MKTIRPVVDHVSSFVQTGVVDCQVRQSSRTNDVLHGVPMVREGRHLESHPTRTGTHLRMEQSGSPDQQRPTRAPRPGARFFATPGSRVLARTIEAGPNSS